MLSHNLSFEVFEIILALHPAQGSFKVLRKKGVNRAESIETAFQNLVVLNTARQRME